MFPSISFRLFCFVIFSFCVSLLFGALVLEYFFFLPPCPLCTLQRICYLFIALVTLLGFIHNPNIIVSYIYLVLALLISFCGLIISGWQVWLQFFHTGEVLSCSAGLFEILDSYTFLEWFKVLFSANVECTDISFKIIYLTIAQWSFIFFIGLTITNFVAIMCLPKKK